MRPNRHKSRRNKKPGCGCKRTLRLWGGKGHKSHRGRKGKKTVRGGFAIDSTYPFPGVSQGNVIPLSGGVGGGCDPTTPANVVDARQTNLF